MEQSILPSTEKYKKYFKAVEPVLEHPDTKRYSTVIFFFLVLSVFGWYAIRPTMQTILYLQRKIKDKTDVTKKMDDKINALIQANANLETIQDQLPLITDAIPSSPEIIPLVQTIRGLVFTNNATVAAMQITNVELSSPSAVPAKKTTSTKQMYPIILTVDGSFVSLYDFFTSLINLRRIVSIDALAITPNMKEGSHSAQTDLKATLKLTTYFTQQ